MEREGRDRIVALETILEELSRICADPPLLRLRPSVLKLQQKLGKNEVCLAVLGQMKRGKSSLLNALLGSDILPTGVLPLTSVVTEIRYAAAPSACVVYQNGYTENVALRDIGDYITESKNPGNRKHVSILRIFYPTEILRNGLVLVDTPGFGSTYSHNTDATLDYLGTVDAAIIVFSIDPPMTEIEANFIKDLQPDIPQLFFVLNKVDLVSEEERAIACEFLKDELTRRLGIVGCPIFPLSAHPVTTDIGSGTEVWGLERFEDGLRDFASTRLDETLISSVAKDAEQIGELASLAIALSRRFASLTSLELSNQHAAMQTLMNEATIETSAIKTLLHQEQAGLVAAITNQLNARVEESVSDLERRLEALRRASPRVSGVQLGHLLETFFNDEIARVFHDWRLQEDAHLSSRLSDIARRYSERAEAILEKLATGISSLIDQPPTALKVRFSLAMDGRVSYFVEPVFYSLDRFLLIFPPILQRPVVYRRIRNSIRDRLDLNAGRIRFDYLERLERSFRALETTLVSQIQDARQTLIEALEAPSTDDFRLSSVRDLQMHLRLLVQPVMQ
jgi:GTP-binding protein EngB required for normal cell division